MNTKQISFLIAAFTSSVVLNAIKPIATLSQVRTIRIQDQGARVITVPQQGVRINTIYDQGARVITVPQQGVRIRTIYDQGVKVITVPQQPGVRVITK